MEDNNERSGCSIITIIVIILIMIMVDLCDRVDRLEHEKPSRDTTIKTS